MANNKILAFVVLTLTLGLTSPDFVINRATVTRVIDGDTFECKLDGCSGSTSIRMLYIDAPEKGQSWNKESKDALMRLLPKDKRIVLHRYPKPDKYGRLLSIVYSPTLQDEPLPLNVNLDMVLRGNAYVYGGAESVPIEILSAENTAKATKEGLWSCRCICPPWLWRTKASRTLYYQSIKAYNCLKHDECNGGK